MANPETDTGISMGTGVPNESAHVLMMDSELEFFFLLFLFAFWSNRID